MDERVRRWSKRRCEPYHPNWATLVHCIGSAHVRLLVTSRVMIIGVAVAGGGDGGFEGHVPVLSAVFSGSAPQRNLC